MTRACVLLLLVACDAADRDVQVRNVPLPGLDTQTAKVDDDRVAADILGECLEGSPANLSIQVVDGPDGQDFWRYRFELVGKAHHDPVACIREHVVKEAP